MTKLRAMLQVLSHHHTCIFHIVRARTHTHKTHTHEREREGERERERKKERETDTETDRAANPSPRACAGVSFGCEEMERFAEQFNVK